TERFEQLEKFRLKRDNNAHEIALDELKTAADTGENVVPPIIGAIRANATLGEITTAMKEVYGTYD
ncbi:methylmalonyl-CoA mutase, partial [bacterium]